MKNINLWKEGDAVVLRGVYEGRPTYAQSMRVIRDTPDETALLIWPGAECAVPKGYIHHPHDASKWDRWAETLTNSLDLQPYTWHTNRFLVLLEPEKFYATIYIWEAEPNQFSCYYINFQLPFRRTPIGFDTLDLDLDIVIEPDFQWKWKDAGEYEHGIRSGGIKTEWVNEIEQAKKEVFARINKREYPLNSYWLNWQPDASWQTPQLPQNWEGT